MLSLHLIWPSGYRRINIERLANPGGNSLSYKQLLHYAVRYSPLFHDVHDSYIDWEVNWDSFMKKWKVETMFLSSQGKWVNISNDQEFNEAFRDSCSRPPTRHVNPYSARNWCKRTSLLEDEAPVVFMRCKTFVTPLKPALKKSESNGSLGKKVKKGTAGQRRAVKRAMKRWASPPKGSINYSKQIGELIQQVMALVTTAAIVLNTRLAEATTPEAQERYCQKAELLLEELREALEQTKELASCEPIKPKFDANFIHGRHGCDGCNSMPIVGLRYHSTNIPDFDLCQKCMQNFKGDSFEFELRQDGKTYFVYLDYELEILLTLILVCLFQHVTPTFNLPKWIKKRRQASLRKLLFLKRKKLRVLKNQ